MAAVANLTLKNNVDADVVYNPVIVKTGEYAKWVDRTTTSILGLQSTAALALVESAKTRKVSGVIYYPTKDAQGVLLVSYGRIEMTLHKDHTSDQRYDVYKRLIAYSGSTPFGLAVTLGETPW